MTTPECCAEFSGVSRRGFLRGSGAVAGIAAASTMLNEGIFREVSYAAGPAAQVLVVLSLRGAADGLSLVVPHGDTAYAPARPRIGIPTASLLQKDERFGLHPNFAPLEPMWIAGRMAAVHATGMATPNRSHFDAMEIVEDADPGSSERRGWINRLVGLTGSLAPEQQISLGNSVDITSVFGATPSVSTPDLRNVSLPGGTDAAWAIRQQTALTTMWGTATSPLANGVRRAQECIDDMAPAVALARARSAPLNGATYGSSSLGRVLADTARLIRADIGAQVVCIDQGNWDMHSGLGTLAWGSMLSNVSDLATNLAAFFTDLGVLADKVTVVTISEFGRRVAENANYGLDHGYGNVMFALGAGVRGGYYAQWPGLAEHQLVSGDLAVTTDYRSVLAEILTRRFGVSAAAVFPGFTPAPVGFML